MGSGKLIKRAIQKHGKENFKKEILFIFETEEEMNLKEKELVNEEFCITENTYNLCIGGGGGFSYLNSDNFENTSHMLDNILKLNEKRLQKLNSNSEFKLITSNNCRLGGLKSKELKLGIHKNKYKFGFKDKFHSIETKKLMSEKAKKRLKEPKNNSQFGTCWITNGIENKKIKKEDLYLWLEKGYNKGRFCKNN